MEDPFEEVAQVDIMGDVRLQRAIVFWSLAVLIVGALAAFVMMAYGMRGGLGLMPWLFGLVAISLAALPLHELIHAVAFRLLGGSSAHVSFGYSTGMLYTSANGAILRRGRFVLVLIAPAVVLSVLFLVVGLCLGCSLLGWCCFFVHLSGCVGDLAMVAAIVQEPSCTHVRDTDYGIDLLKRH